MNFFNNLLANIKNKQAELKEKKEFLDLVESKAKPIRRASYMKQMMNKAIEQGVALANAEYKASLPKEKKTEEDFGFAPSENWGFLNDKPKTITKSKGKKQ